MPLDPQASPVALVNLGLLGYQIFGICPFSCLLFSLELAKKRIASAGKAIVPSEDTGTSKLPVGLSCPSMMTGAEEVVTPDTVHQGCEGHKQHKYSYCV